MPEEDVKYRRFDAPPHTPYKKENPGIGRGFPDNTPSIND